MKTVKVCLILLLLNVFFCRLQSMNVIKQSMEYLLAADSSGSIGHTNPFGGLISCIERGLVTSAGIAFGSIMAHELGHAIPMLLSGSPVKFYIGDPESRLLFDSKYCAIGRVWSVLAAVEPLRPISGKWRKLTMYAGGPLLGALFCLDILFYNLNALHAREKRDLSDLYYAEFLCAESLSLLLMQLTNLLPINRRIDGYKLLLELGIPRSSVKRACRKFNQVITTCPVFLSLVMAGGVMLGSNILVKSYA